MELSTPTKMPLSLSLSLLSLFCLIFVRIVDLPEIKGNHRKFRTLVTSYIGKALITTTVITTKLQQ